MEQSDPSDTGQMNRRRLVKAGMVASPLIATLASRPVQAVQGLSNMASGDASVCRGDDRYGGMSPGFWKTPNGKTMEGVPILEAWSLAGYDYGTLINGKKGNKWEHYTGGTPFSSVFTSSSDSRSFREVLNTDSGSDQFHLIAGLLNVKYYEARAAGGTTAYFMTTQQFWDLYNGVISVPPPYTSFKDLIESNYGKGPGSDCPSDGWDDDIVYPRGKNKNR